jgi:hypothetical protein
MQPGAFADADMGPSCVILSPVTSHMLKSRCFF